jgi:EmrB/QacA subfamily drug resistance transporter
MGMIPTSRIIPLVLAAALFMENMDSTIIATALPDIALDLRVDPIDLKLAFTTYLLSLAVFLPICGWTADRFGAKLVFRLAIIVFTVGSMLCGFASTLAELVAARGLQGLGGAMMVPVGRIILLRAVPKSDLVDALAWLTIPALIGPVMGPPIGGFITTFFDWRWIFWMNIPFGVLAFVLASWFMPNTTEAAAPALDVKGFVLSGLGLGFTVFGLTIFGRGLFSGATVVAMIVGGVILLIAYWYHAKRIEFPIINLSLLNVPTFRAAVVGGSLYRIGAGAVPFLLPLMLQLGFGLTAFQSGLITCASAGGALVMKFWVKFFIQRFGFRQLLVLNVWFGGASIAAYSLFTPTTPFIIMFGFLFGAGLLRSLQFTAHNSLAYSEIDHTNISSATSFYTTVQNLSIALGVASAAYILDAARYFGQRNDVAIQDFRIAFVVVGVISMLSFLSYLKLDKNAGSEVSGKVIT